MPILEPNVFFGPNGDTLSLQIRTHDSSGCHPVPLNFDLSFSASRKIQIGPDVCASHRRTQLRGRPGPLSRVVAASRRSISVHRRAADSLNAADVFSAFSRVRRALP